MMVMGLSVFVSKLRGAALTGAAHETALALAAETDQAAAKFYCPAHGPDRVCVGLVSQAPDTFAVVCAGCELVMGTFNIDPVAVETA